MKSAVRRIAADSRVSASLAPSRFFCRRAVACLRCPKSVSRSSDVRILDLRLGRRDGDYVDTYRATPSSLVKAETAQCLLVRGREPHEYSSDCMKSLPTRSTTRTTHTGTLAVRPRDTESPNDVLSLSLSLFFSFSFSFSPASSTTGRAEFRVSCATMGELKDGRRRHRRRQRRRLRDFPSGKYALGNERRILTSRPHSTRK